MPESQGRFARAYLMLAATMLLWAGNAVASRLAVGHLSPMALTALRLVVVVAILAMFVRRQVRAEWPLLRAHIGFVAWLGLIGFAAFTGLMYWAAQHTTAVNITILQGSIPVFVLLGMLAVHGVAIRGAQALGIVVTLAGVVLLASQGDWASLAALTFNKGDLAMMLACLLWGIYTIGLRSKPAMSGLVFFAGVSFFALLGSLVLLAAEIAAGAVVWPTSFRAFAIIAYVGILPSLVAQMLYIRGVELIGPGRAGVFVNLVPVFGATLGAGLLGERFGWVEGAALLLVIGGILLAERQFLRGAGADRAI